jgi:DNA-binding transcriptional regulator YdaS (Cro superfamily)
MTPLEQAIYIVGGHAALARALNMSRAAIYLWKQVPAERVVAVEKASGIAREKLRPDLYRH